MGIDPTKITDPPAPPPGGNPPSPAPTPAPPTPVPSGAKTPLDTLPADVQDYIKELRDEAEAARKARTQAAAEKTRAENERLRQQGEFQKLAEQHEARVRELEPIATNYSTLASLIAKQIDAQIKEWPAELKAFDPGKDAPVEQRLAWVEKAQPLLAQMQAGQRAGSPGAAPGPRPTAKPTAQENMDEMTRRLKATGRYGF